MKAEVDRYKEHALEKLSNDILKARERIYAILTKLSVNDATENSKYAILYTSNDEPSNPLKKRSFPGDFTEDIYFMHEELLQELEAQYEVNRSMYEQIEIWNELFLEYQEFEVSVPLIERTKNDDRLPTSRKMPAILNDSIVVVTVPCRKKRRERDWNRPCTNVKFVSNICPKISPNATTDTSF